MLGGDVEQQRPAEAAQAGHHGQPAQHRPLRRQVVSLGVGPGQVTGTEGHRVGHIGCHRRNPDGGQGGKGNQRPSAGQGVDGAGGQRRPAGGQIIPPGEIHSGGRELQEPASPTAVRTSSMDATAPT